MGCAGSGTAAPTSAARPRSRRLARRPSWRLPASRLEQLLGREAARRNADHRLAEPRADAREDVAVHEVRRRLDDRARALVGVTRLEDPGADEHAVGAELHA